MDELKRLLSNNLKTLRAYHGLTQEGLAEAAGISKNYLAEIETGRKYPSNTVYLRLSTALGVAPARLLEDASGPFPPRARAGSSVGAAPFDDLNAMMVRELTNVVNRFVPPAKPAPGDEKADDASSGGD